MGRMSRKLNAAMWGREKAKIQFEVSVARAQLFASTEKSASPPLKPKS